MAYFIIKQELEPEPAYVTARLHLVQVIAILH